MKPLTRGLMVGSLTLALTIAGVRAVLAGPPVYVSIGMGHPSKHVGPYPMDPGFNPNWPGHHKWPHYAFYPQPIVTPVIRPVIVSNMPSYDELEASNPAPMADVRLVNPAENRVALKYRLDDGELQTIPPGASIAIGRVSVISFDRGGNAGPARYTLTDGIYTFKAAGGKWDLANEPLPDSAAAQVAEAAANPLPSN